MQPVFRQTEASEELHPAFAVEPPQTAEKLEVFESRQFVVKAQFGGQETDGHPAFFDRQVATLVPRHDAAFLRSHQASQATQQGAFAATVGAGDQQDFTPLDFGAHITQDLEAAETAGKAFDPK